MTTLSEPKAGYKTTEFWTNIGVSLVAFIGVINPDLGTDEVKSGWEAAVKAVGMAVMAISNLGYSISRGLAKKGK